VGTKKSGKGEVRHFTDLVVWQRARMIRNRIYEIAAGLPVVERYNLTPQLTRAACSVTANIAEGYGRYHYKENIQFCRQARGSLYELQDHLIACNDLKYLDDIIFNELFDDIKETIKILDGYIRFLQDGIRKNENLK